MTINRKGFLIALALSFVFFWFMLSLAGAAPVTCGQHGCSDWRVAPSAAPRLSAKSHVRRHASRRGSRRIARTHHRHIADANGNSAFATLHTAAGLTAKVAASAANQFQGFIDAVEADIIPDMGVGNFVETITIKGNRISDLGCLARGGHMPHSKHYRGLACDFGQLKRNVSTDKFMYHVTEIAHEHGLTDGCEWGRRRGERFTGPDCGHIEVPGPTRTMSASRHRHHHRHYARAG
jgi:hypothetical protein